MSNLHDKIRSFLCVLHKILKTNNLTLYFGKQIKYNEKAIWKIIDREVMKMKNIKKILAVIMAAVLVCVSFAACSKTTEVVDGDSDYAYIQGKGTLVIGIT